MADGSLAKAQFRGYLSLTQTMALSQVEDYVGSKGWQKFRNGVFAPLPPLQITKVHSYS